MADVKIAYGTQGQGITCTLASLASSASAGRESTGVDNRTNKYLDALVRVSIKTQNSGTISTTDPWVYVFAYGTTDDGTTYPDNVTGTDAAITLNTISQLPIIGAIHVAAINTTYHGGPWSVASAFGGVLPAFWGIVVKNSCGTALSATEGDHIKQYQGVYSTVV